MMHLLDFEHDSAGNLIGVTVDYDGERIELERVRHEVWKKIENGGFYWFECSQCGNRPMRDRSGFMNCSDYCPYCGAEMSREDEQYDD